MGGVLHQPEPLAPGHILDVLDPAGDQAADVHHDHPGRGSREGPLDVFRAYAERFRVHVHPNGAPAGMNHRGGGGEERIGRDEDVFALHAQDPQNDLESAGPAAHGDGVASAAEPREFFLELLPVPAERQLPGGQHFLDAVGNPDPVFREKLDLGCRDHAGRSLWQMRIHHGLAAATLLPSALIKMTPRTTSAMPTQRRGGTASLSRMMASTAAKPYSSAVNGSATVTPVQDRAARNSR